MAYILFNNNDDNINELSSFSRGSGNITHFLNKSFLQNDLKYSSNTDFDYGSG